MNLTGEDIWEPGLDAVLVTPGAGMPSYSLVAVERTTNRQVITGTGARFWQDTGREVGGPRELVPSYAPVFPILAAQVAESARRERVGSAYLEFAAQPGRATAEGLRRTVDKYLDGLA